MSAPVAARRGGARGGDALAPVLLAVVGVVVLAPVLRLIAYAVFDPSAPLDERVGFARLAAAFEHVSLATLAANSLT